ncbi:sporulation histidine kinase inhibitor Sda [Heyndrickxia vini]|uniref:Sporulation histidine kinase inhibitor Sda n=1 Tax=Heyndrickxia vini TaxID=1476025 RepID=A0ABX7DY48_9BACI|nr:sporulation histidine kinase inhibitor Sda [Heyndrickxia vini]QQZ07850.1 sporulation histidine kinase inhibitor Sda [Heyndrickxia vini]
MDRQLPLSNEFLLLTYKKAIKLKLPKEFIEMLREELEKRQLQLK